MTIRRLRRGNERNGVEIPVGRDGALHETRHDAGKSAFPLVFVHAHQLPGELCEHDGARAVGEREPIAPDSAQGNGVAQVALREAERRAAARACPPPIRKREVAGA